MADRDRVPRERPRHRDERPPTPPAPPRPPEEVSEAERTRERLGQRAEELRASHWVSYTCRLGHHFEGHRYSVPNMCPICHQAFAVEDPDSRALREHMEQSTPLALMQRAWDAISEWAQQHLDASVWTQRSDAARAARERQQTERAGGYEYHDL